MKQAVAIIAIIVIIAAGWLAFGNKKNNQPVSNSSQTTNSNTNSSTANSTQAVATNKVSIANMAFSPANITIKKGTQVIWTNRDSIGHTVTQDDNSPAGGPGLDSKVLSPGESYSATFSQAGTFHYHCSIHPQMTGTITVTQ